MRTAAVTPLLASTVFLSGVAFAAITPYRSVVGIEALGLSNQVFAVVMALNAIAGALTSLFIGWLSDRLGDRRKLVILSAMAGVVAFAILWLVRTPLAFISVYCVLLPFGTALFSQSFAYSRAYYDKNAPRRSEFLMSVLRSGFTLAWIIVPPLAGWLAGATASFSVFGLAMLAHVIATLAVGLLWLSPGTRIAGGQSTPEAAASAEPLRLSLSRAFGVSGVTLAQTALQVNLTVLPMIIIRDLGGTLEQVGLNAGFAAVIEMPIMILWGVLAMRMRKETILAITSLIFGVYFACMWFAQSFLMVLLFQIPAAIAIAGLLSINISYLQDVFQNRVGLSTALLDVTTVVSAMLAAIIFALVASETYREAMLVAMALCAAAALLMLLSRWRADTPKTVSATSH
mgnify:CR=1 FL=1